MTFRKFLIDTVSSFLGRNAGVHVALWFLGQDVAKDVLRRTREAFQHDNTIVHYKVYTKIEYMNDIPIPDGVPSDLSTNGGIMEMPNKWRPKDWTPTDDLDLERP
jgi:hypothetical protein